MLGPRPGADDALSRRLRALGGKRDAALGKRVLGALHRRDLDLDLHLRLEKARDEKRRGRADLAETSPQTRSTASMTAASVT